MKNAQYTARVNDLHDFELESKDGNYLLNGEQVDLDLATRPNGKWHAIFQGISREVELVEVDKETMKCTMRIDGRRYEVQLNDEYDVLLANMGIEKGGSKKIKEIKAPMPGLVLELVVEPGDEVEEGDILVILEAMKMENALKSPISGKIASVDVKQGEAVEKNALLVSFE